MFHVSLVIIRAWSTDLKEAAPDNYQQDSIGKSSESSSLFDPCSFMQDGRLVRTTIKPMTKMILQSPWNL